MTKKKSVKPTSKGPKSPITKVVISGRGLSFSVLDIDQETFVRFTRSGISSEEFDSLRDQLDEAGYYITAPFLDATTVLIDGQEFRSSWENIKGQCGETLPPPTKIYAVPPKSYSVVAEHIHEGEFAKARIADFDQSKLRFDVEHVHLAKGQEYVLLDPYYDLETLDAGNTTSHGDIYVVDGKGKRFELVFEND